MSKFTDLLKHKRKEKGLTQKETAKEFGWTSMYYGRFENGHLIPTKLNLRLFATFLEIDIKELQKILDEKQDN